MEVRVKEVSTAYLMAQKLFLWSTMMPPLYISAVNWVLLVLNSWLRVGGAIVKALDIFVFFVLMTNTSIQ